MYIYERIEWARLYSVPGAQVVIFQSAMDKLLGKGRLLPSLPLVSALAYSSLNVSTEVGYPFGIVDVSPSRKG